MALPRSLKVKVNPPVCEITATSSLRGLTPSVSMQIYRMSTEAVLRYLLEGVAREVGSQHGSAADAIVKFDHALDWLCAAITSTAQSPGAKAGWPCPEVSMHSSPVSPGFR